MNACHVFQACGSLASPGKGGGKGGKGGKKKMVRIPLAERELDFAYTALNELC